MKVASVPDVKVSVAEVCEVSNGNESIFDWHLSLEGDVVFGAFGTQSSEQMGCREELVYILNYS